MFIVDVYGLECRLGRNKIGTHKLLKPLLYMPFGDKLFPVHISEVLVELTDRAQHTVANVAHSLAPVQRHVLAQVLVVFQADEALLLRVEPLGHPRQICNNKQRDRLLESLLKSFARNDWVS